MRDISLLPGAARFKGLKRRAKRFAPRWLERLEDRTMLANGVLQDVVVGRALSSYFAGDVPANRQVSLTLTVYNQQADAESGVLLTDTLAEGVSLVDASIAPDRDGQKLAWSLGTIPGYDRRSVTLTLRMPSTIPSQVDTGAIAFATLNAGTITDTAPPAALRAGSLSDPTLLASTPDANTTDPFIQEAAARLDYEPQAIFNFLRDDIGYNSYVGSLRGARGTLWSSAGNSLDVASLGVALMRASGVPAQYQQGNLPNNLTQQLILSMFPPSIQTVGLIPPGTQTTNPLNDFTLYTDSQKHTWFQFDTGDGQGMRDADPLFDSASVGQTFATATATFAEVPDDQRHKVQLTLNVESYSQIGALFGFGNGLSTSMVLDQTFNAVDLVGRPISIGNLVTQSAIGALVFASRTTTYTPYFLVGDLGLHAQEQPEPILGTPFQEVSTNFPLANQALTGLFLKIKLTSPSGPLQEFERALYDRIGYAARQGTAGASVSLDPNGDPALSPFDVATLSALPAFQSRAATQFAQAQSLEALAAVQAATNPTTVAQVAALIAHQRAQLAQFAMASDTQTANLARAYNLAAYFDRPRLTMYASKASVVNRQPELSLSFDLVRDTIRAIAAPGQASDAVRAFAAVRGIFDSYLEAALVPVVQNGVNLSSAYIIQQAIEQGIPLIPIGPANLSELQALKLPADAVTRITANVEAGKLVIVPARTVTIGSEQTIAWWVGDPTTGETLSQGRDGGYQGLTTLAVATLIVNIIISAALSYYTTDLVNWAAGLLNRPDLISNPWKSAAIGAATGLVGNLILSFVLSLAILWATSPLGPLAKLDPPVAPLLVGMDIPFPDAPDSTGDEEVNQQTNRSAGAVRGDLPHRNAKVSGDLNASWNSSGSTFQVQTLDSSSATVSDAAGQRVGSGIVALATLGLTSAAVSGNSLNHQVTGTGSLAFYGRAETNLGASGEWQSYTATVSGGVSIRVTTDGLRLNGQPLAPGTYTITTASATLSGRGSTSSPSFAGSASITASGATVQLGPAAGKVDVGGQAVDARSGVTLAGYTGTLNIAGNATDNDAVALNGTAAHALTVSADPASASTDQNTPLSIQTDVRTSFADTYTITANAPKGWAVTVDTTGGVVATPAPGVQGGTFPIQIIAKSRANPDLVAQTTVNVTINPTQPSVTLRVDPDPIFTVPFGDAQVPSAFQAVIRNTGPAADTFNPTFSNVPAGFTVVTSRPSVVVPAGQTGILGVYLVPNAGQPLPPPGTQLSFTVAVRSASDASITQSETEIFIMPEVRGVALASTPGAVSTTPGVARMAALTIKSVGNVAQTITLSVDATGGLAVSGLSTITLQPGQSTTQAVTLTPAGDIPLNSTLRVTLTPTFAAGSPPVIPSLNILVRVVAPGVDAVAAAAVAARQLDNPALANRFNDLAIALTNLFQSPGDLVFKGQAIANLDSLISQLTSDPFLSDFTGGLISARAAVSAAATASDVQAALTNLGQALDSLAAVITNVAEHGFTASLTPDRQIVQPGAPLVFSIPITNDGSAATTYDLSVSGLPANVTAQFSQPSVTLQPGQALVAGQNAPTLTLTMTGDTLAAAGFTVTVAAQGAPEITRSLAGQLTLRDEIIVAGGVAVTPPSAPAGTPVAVAVKVQGVVNQPTSITAYFEVLNPAGVALFTSPSAPVDLTTTSGLLTVPLGSFDTTGLADGPYTVRATLSTGSAATAPLLIGQPVSANLTTTPSVIPTNTETVTSTVTVSALGVFPDPLTLLGAATTPAPGTSVAIYQTGGQTYAYESGTGGVDAFNVTDPSNPQLLKVFGESDLNNGNFGFNIVRVVGDKLVVATTVTLNANGFNLLVYSLADPANPTFVSNTFIGRRFLSDMLLNSTATAAFVPTNGVFFFGNTISSLFGNFTSIDLSNPASPVLGDSLVDNLDGGPQRQFGGTLVNDQVAYSAGITPGGAVFGNRGNLSVIDISNLSAISVIKEVAIPGTINIVDIAAAGNRALAVGDVGPESNVIDFNARGLSGRLALTVFDITDPRNPVIIGQTLVTNNQFPINEPGGKIDVVALGNGAFAVSGTAANGLPALAVIDASDENNIVIGAIQTPSFVHGITVAGDKVYATTATGLSIYQINPLVSSPVTVTVNLPAGTADAIVAGSFNIAPTEINKSASGDTLVWRRSFAAGSTTYTFSWQTTVAGVQAGQSAAVTTGATVSYVDQGAPGSVTLPGTRVSAVPFLTVGPAQLTQQPGGTSTYNVRVTNPTDAEVTFSLSTQQTPFVGQVNLPFQVKVPARGAVDVPMTVKSNTFAQGGDAVITVKAGFTRYASDFRTKLADYQDSATTTLKIAGAPAVTPVEEAHGVVVQLTPAEATVGKDGEARFVVRVTNTGSDDDFFSLAADALPPGVTAQFESFSLSVPPGAANFREVLLVVRNFSADPGNYPFTVTATASGDRDISAQAAGTLRVVSQGVSVSLAPDSRNPGEGFTLTVRNTGDQADTFDLVLGGPGALVANLAASRVTLDAGASRQVAVTTGAVNFALPGSLGIAAMATSTTAAAVRDMDTGTLTILAAKAMTAALDRATVTLPKPGTGSFPITVRNTGNIEDSYRAVISGKTGPVTAFLVGLDGQPTTSIDTFRLTALGAGQLVLRITAANGGTGTTTVQIRSLTDDSIVATVTATLVASATAAPRVVGVERLGIHARPTTLVVAFDRPLDRASAEDERNYILTGPRGRIRILQAVYDAVTNTVTLRPARRLPLNTAFRLTVRGTGASAVLGSTGRKLDGDADGAAGGDYKIKITRKLLVRPGTMNRLPNGTQALTLVRQSLGKLAKAKAPLRGRA